MRRRKVCYALNQIHSTQPAGAAAAKRRTVAARAASGFARRQTIAFVDVGFGGGYEFLEQMQGWFAQLPAARADFM